MAKKQTIASRKREITQKLAHQRAELSKTRAEIKDKLNFKKQLGNAVKKKPKALFLGSLATGLAGTVLFKRRGKKSKKKPEPAKPTTMGQMLLSWLLSLLKPAAKAFLVSMAKKIAADRMSPKRP